MSADRNLLFGILALQMDFITRDALIAAMHAWVMDKAKPLGAILQAQGALGADEHELLEALVVKHLQRHANDPEKSLASVSSIGSVRRQLQEMADPELHASLGHVSRARNADEDLYRTRAGTVGTPTSSGLRFRILRPHAKGGLGQVSVAHDEELHREVALKEIQDRHADHPESRARFVLEAEITGGLEHPGIVPVYGLGAYADGRPFYAMRFVRGDSLQDAIACFHKTDVPGWDAGERALALRQLLGRFIDVCNAIAYAHSRGVLHRDVKPGNIMLGKFGETLVVDWGLAKPLGHKDAGVDSDEGILQPALGSRSTPTQMGAAIGTPPYMSPEQAAGRLDQLGPASDVYSLGATLYYLLTGKPPFEEKDVGALLQKVQHGEFLPPSQAKSGVPRALEAICLKAMARKPEDRYPTALRLAADIEHWLADEPVSAYPEPWLVRTQRWLRGHRPLVAGAAALLLAAVPLSLVIAVNREHALRQAEADKREIARREAETKAVLEFVKDRVFAAARPEGEGGGLGHAVTLRQAVESALPYVAKSFTDQPLIEARLRLTLGTSFRYLGDAKASAEQEEAARALYARHRGPDHPDTLGSINNLASSYADLGRHADALKLFKETLALEKTKLGPDHPDTLKTMNNLALSYADLGRHAEAFRLHEETLALMKAKLGPDHPDTLKSMHNLANSYAALGRHGDALKLQEETLALRKAKLGADHPDTLRSMSNLAISYANLGRHADAFKLQEESLALMKAKFGLDHPNTLKSLNNLAISYADLGRHAEALKLREETLALMRAKFGPDHANTLASMNGLANSYAALGQHMDALKLREESLALRKARFGPDHPDTLASMNDLANSYAALRRHADALKLREETLTLRKTKFGPDHPNTLKSMANLANSYAVLGRHADALKLREETLMRMKAKLGPDHPDTLKSIWGVAASLVQLERGSEAVPIIDDCVQRATGKVFDPALVPAIMDLRLRHFEKTKDPEGCRQTAVLWEKLNPADAASLYDAACMRAVTAAVLRTTDPSPTGTRQADAEVEQAMVWLKKAVAAGYKDFAHMKKDTDLDPLRSHPEFQQLLKEVEAKAKEDRK